VAAKATAEDVEEFPLNFHMRLAGWVLLGVIAMKPSFGHGSDTAAATKKTPDLYLMQLK
jgi:hypothetical protein